MSNVNEVASTNESPANEFPAEANSRSGQGPLWIFGGIGCTLILCVSLLTASWLLLARNVISAPADQDTVALNSTTPAQEDPDLESEVQNEPALADVSDSAAAEVEEDDQAVPAGDPAMESITFALQSTAKGEPIEADFAFEQGVTEIHALFEYKNLGPGNDWTQVWYHNGNELVSTSQPWLEDPNGIYDYVVQAGGDPLPAGQWALEFYVDDELLTAGSFMIEGQTEAAENEDIPELADLPKIYRLIYTKWNGEKHDLYLSDTGGGREQFVMSKAAGPSWSRDGRYIFFYGEEGVDWQIVNGNRHALPGVTNGIVRLNASPVPASVTQLRMFQGQGWNDGTARWANVAPDGAMIAYDGDRGGGRRIYFLGTNANQQFRFEIVGEQADWAPDGQKIVYRSGRDNRTGIWISNRNDSGHTLITNGGTDSFPAWSPDGKTIAFSREAGGNVDIYSVNIDGTDLTRLTTTPGHDTLPTFAPNGDIIFRSARNGSWAIWKMAADGSAQSQIIANAPVGPEWSFSRMSVQR